MLRMMYLGHIYDSLLCKATCCETSPPRHIILYRDVPSRGQSANSLSVESTLINCRPSYLDHGGIQRQNLKDLRNPST